MVLLVGLPTGVVSSRIWLDPWGWDPFGHLLKEQVPSCCPRPAISIEYGVSYDNTSPSLDRSSSTNQPGARFETARAGCCWHHTIPSSHLSTDSHFAAQTGSRSPLVDWAVRVVQHSLSSSLAAELARSVPTVHPEPPTAWYNSFDTPCSLFGSHLQFCSRSVILLSFKSFYG